jgi:hypothetical protein
MIIEWPGYDSDQLPDDSKHKDLAPGCIDNFDLGFERELATLPPRLNVITPSNVKGGCSKDGQALPAP